jgi:hypothetical protein
MDYRFCQSLNPGRPGGVYAEFGSTGGYLPGARGNEQPLKAGSEAGGGPAPGPGIPGR